jgi:hypothetical protein
MFNPKKIDEYEMISSDEKLSIPVMLSNPAKSANKMI